jgi:hypothetical protein
VQLNRLPPAAVAALLALVVLGASQAAANFAASPGFSGKKGATCLACHTLAPFPLTPPAAQAKLEGLPDAWTPGVSYPIVVRVEGGPAAMPAPQPQGGFDLASDGGRFGFDPVQADLFRQVDAQEVTYRPAGTLTREWHLTWTAPHLATKPAPVRLWLAVLAADGNHVVATNTSDGGERFDSAASLQALVPPAAGATAAWNALPLRAPTATAVRTADGWRVEGRHLDGNATALRFRLDDGPWQARDTGASWALAFPGLSGGHTLTLRSDGLGRASPDLTLALPGSGSAASTVTAGSEASPAPLVPLALLVLFLATRRRTA